MGTGQDDGREWQGRVWWTWKADITGSIFARKSASDGTCSGATPRNAAHVRACKRNAGQTPAPMLAPRRRRRGSEPSKAWRMRMAPLTPCSRRFQDTINGLQCGFCIPRHGDDATALLKETQIRRAEYVTIWKAYLPAATGYHNIVRRSWPLPEQDVTRIAPNKIEGCASDGAWSCITGSREGRQPPRRGGRHPLKGERYNAKDHGIGATRKRARFAVLTGNGNYTMNINLTDKLCAFSASDVAHGRLTKVEYVPAAARHAPGVGGFSQVDISAGRRRNCLAGADHRQARPSQCKEPPPSGAGSRAGAPMSAKSDSLRLWARNLPSRPGRSRGDAC